MRFIPDEHDFAGLDRSSKALKPLRCEQHGNLVFVNFDADAPALGAFLGGLQTLLADLPWNELRTYKVFEWDVNCNWKCIHDAFSESYHVKYVHQNSVNKAINQSYTARHMLRNGHNSMIVKNRAGSGVEMANVFDHRSAEELAATPESLLSEITRQAQRSYNIFPNLTLPVAENLSTVLSVWPLAVDRCRVRLYYIKMSAADPIDTEADQQTVAFFNAILQEDFGAVSGMNASLADGGIREIPLCVGEQFLYNVHQELDEVIGREHVPADLRVVPVALPRPL